MQKLTSLGSPVTLEENKAIEYTCFISWGPSTWREKRCAEPVSDSELILTPSIQGPFALCSKNFCPSGFACRPRLPNRTTFQVITQERVPSWTLRKRGLDSGGRYQGFCGKFCCKLPVARLDFGCSLEVRKLRLANTLLCMTRSTSSYRRPTGDMTFQETLHCPKQSLAKQYITETHGPQDPKNPNPKPTAMQAFDQPRSLPFGAVAPAMSSACHSPIRVPNPLQPSLY